MKRVVLAGLTATFCTVTLPACAPPAPSTQYPTPPQASSLAPQLTEEQLTAAVEDMRAELETAYNAVTVEPAPTLEQYDTLYEPVWEKATQLGFTLTRRPYLATDEFILNAEQAITPGHSLLTEVTAPVGTWCIASTDSLDPKTLTAEQWELSKENPREFVILEGSCQPVIDYLATVFPLEVDPAMEDALTNDGTGTPEALPPNAP